MSRTVQMILCFLLSSLICGGQQKASPLSWSGTEWDFGKQKEDGGLLMHEFAFTNVGRDSVLITGVQVFCRCTKAEFPRRKLAPGEKGIIKVIFDPYGYTGPVHKGVTVQTDLGSKDNLYFRTELTPRVKPVEEEYPILVPPGLRVEKTELNFAVLKAGESKTVQLRVANVYDRALKLVLRRAGGGALSDLHMEDSKTVAPGEKLDIDITYGPCSLTGIFADTLVMEVDDASFLRSVITDAGEETIVTQVTMAEKPQNYPEGVKGPSAYISGTYTNFGKYSASASPVTKSFTLLNRGDQPLFVRDIRPVKGFVINLEKGAEVAPGASLPFTITFDPATFPQGNVFETLRILFNDPQNPIRDLMLAARVL